MTTLRTSPRSDVYSVPEAPAYRRDRGMNVADAERGGSMLAAGGLLGYALVRRSLPLAALGAFLAYRGASGRCALYGSLGYSSRDRVRALATRFARSVTVNRPREEVRTFLGHGDGSGAFGELGLRYSVELDDAPGKRGTIVRLKTAAAASRFARLRAGRELRRMKQLLEAGEVPTTVGQPAGPSLCRSLTNIFWRTS